MPPRKKKKTNKRKPATKVSGKPSKAQTSPAAKKKTKVAGKEIAFNWSAVPPPSKACSENFEIDEELEKLRKRPPTYRALDQTGNYYRGTLDKPKLCSLDEWPKCECPPSTGCGDDCINRLMFVECNVKFCQGGHGREGGCGNAKCQSRAFPETEVKLTPGCGWGLIVKDFVKKGRPIVEYCGKCVALLGKPRRLYTSPAASAAVGFGLTQKSRVGKRPPLLS